MSVSGWIGVDFDGTLAHYEGYVPGRRFGDPIPAMMARVEAWLAQGVEVRIMTARAADPDEARAVQDWCERHGLPRLTVTDRKDYAMVELWDDRAVRVLFNKGERCCGTVTELSRDALAVIEAQEKELLEKDREIGGLVKYDAARDAVLFREKDEEIARLKAELELARGFMPKGTTLAPPSHEPWRKG